MTRIKVGDKVAYSANFLRNTGQIAGESGHARGIVKSIKSYGKSFVLAEVDWDCDEPTNVHVANLAIVGGKGFAAN